MLRQPRIRASRASPAQKWRGLRVVLFTKRFKGYIFCFLGDLVGRYIFEQFARETNLKKKHSVTLIKDDPFNKQQDIKRHYEHFPPNYPEWL